ncbi:MAG TPA: SAM-dependent methyltransferase [Pseudonocardiaceae bacterium]
MTAEDLSWVPLDVDVSRPNPARVYDYLLGGANNFDVDRGLAKKMIEMIPDVAFVAIENRSFLRRAVRFLAESGIDQFLDLGSGIPTVGNTHEVAQEINPDCRVIYVDQEAVAVAHSELLLADNDQADIVRADVRKPAEVLGDRKTRALLDFSRPVAVLMFAVIHFMDADDHPAELISAYRDLTVPGSYLAMSHGTMDGRPELIEAVQEYSNKAGARGTLRGRDEIMTFFDGYDLLDPGLVFTPQWRGELEVCDPWRSGVYAGVGKKV